jgi:hypothetical protein
MKGDEENFRENEKFISLKKLRSAVDMKIS